ncbi:MAG: guanylate kinase [Methylotetracoccus sp.]|jgi:guanylate kinase|nr:guanylate kinase [Methylotetracoccus sp.]
MNRGCLFILSAPSGAGKTSLVDALRTAISDFAVSVSHTTRSRRPGEEHGRAYYFVGHSEFEAMIAEGAFLEYARVFDNYYGTAHRTIEARLDDGIDVLLEIDWQGARQVRTRVPECVSIFVLPPSRQSLEERLRARGQDDVETIARRMRDATSEMSHYAEYDYLVVNDDFEDAVEQLGSIILAHRLRAARQTARLAELIDSLLDA